MPTALLRDRGSPAEGRVALAIALMQNGRNIFTVWAIGDDHVPSQVN